MPDAQAQLDYLRQKRAEAKQTAAAKRDQAKQAAAEKLQALKEAERSQLDAIDRRIRRAESRLRGQARRDDTRLKVLIGASALLAAQSSPQRRKRLIEELDYHLVRPADRALCARLLERPELVRDREPISAGGSLGEPLPGFRTCRLEDNSYGSSWRGDTSLLPANLGGLWIEVTDSSNNSFLTRITEVIKFSPSGLIVRDSGRHDQQGAS